MRSNLVHRAAVALLLLPLAASAAHQKPGLWEITSTMTILKGGPQMPAGAQAQQLPPEALARMKQMGIQIQQGGGPMSHTVSFQRCLTPEQAAKDEHPTFTNDNKCQLQNAHYTGSSFTGDMVCNTPDMQGKGTIKASFPSSEAYSGTWHFAGKSARSGEMEMNNEFAGKWLGADCGTVKPFGPPPAPPAH